ncbi:MAG: polysaccharide deacetylase family protein [Simkaniaceae bacterium]|nr:polysaccharide deacetylase family protein [Simkaniaceae bacterium]
MLLALLYHKIGTSKYANPLKTLEDHFQWISSRYPTVLPGELLSHKCSICLTFDDAFFDFYHSIFPLLKKYQLKALLAVPTAYIPEEIHLFFEKRLEKVQTFPNKAPPVPSPAFCSWTELKELALSPLIQIASHSIHHHPMTSTHIDPEHELLVSKALLEEKLDVSVNSFVYPFGLWNKKVHAIAKKHYEYIFRIGNAYNRSWKNANQLLYRVNGDQLPKVNFPFSPLFRLKHTARYFFNTVRGK